MTSAPALTSPSAATERSTVPATTRMRGTVLVQVTALADGDSCRTHARYLLNYFPAPTPAPALGILPQPSPQPVGCRADTQIACPDLQTRICEVQRCDGVQDCPKEEDQREELSWDEAECANYDNVTFETRPPEEENETTTIGERMQVMTSRKVFLNSFLEIFCWTEHVCTNYPSTFHQ